MLFLASSYFEKLGGKNGLVSVITIVTIALVILAVLLFKNKTVAPKVVAMASISIALATVLSNIYVYQMPFGGSITLFSLLPIILFAFMYGPTAGIGAGLIFGMIQFMFKPWFFTPIQFLLDYVLAFGSVGLAGFAGQIKNKSIGLMVAVPIGYLCKLFFSFWAGFIFVEKGWWAESIFGLSTQNMHGMVYSLVYNAGYVIPELLLALVVMVIIANNKALIKVINQHSRKCNFNH